MTIADRPAPAWRGPLVRLRPGVLHDLDDVPRDVLAHELGVTTPTLRRYVDGDSTPGWTRQLSKCAELLGQPVLDLIETETGQPLGSPCPAWCDDHDLVITRCEVSGFVEVLRSGHRSHVTHAGPWQFRLLSFGTWEHESGPVLCHGAGIHWTPFDGGALDWFLGAEPDEIVSSVAAIAAIVRGAES